MNVTVLYRPNSEHERAVLTFERDFKKRTSKTLDMVSLDTPEGAELARTYDITRYPAIIARREDGAVLRTYQGLPLPLINEISYYAQDVLGNDPAHI